MKPESAETALVIQPKAQTGLDLFDDAKVNSAMLVAKQISASALVPKAYYGNPANVFVAMHRANRLGLDVFAFMESTYPVNNKIGYEGKLIIALINNSGLYKNRLQFNLEGDTKETKKCQAWAIDKDSGDKLLGPWCSYQLAKDNGWTEPKEQKIWENNQVVGKKMVPSKWDTLTDMMLMYRSAKFFGTMYCPDLLLGMYLREELEEIDPNAAVEAESSVVKTELLPVKNADSETVAKPETPTPTQPTQEKAPETVHVAPKKPVEDQKPPEQPQVPKPAPSTPQQPPKTAKKQDAKKPEPTKPEQPKPESPKPEQPIGAYLKTLQQKFEDAKINIDEDVVPFFSAVNGPKMIVPGKGFLSMSEANAKFCVDNFSKVLVKVAEYKAKNTKK